MTKDTSDDPTYPGRMRAARTSARLETIAKGSIARPRLIFLHQPEMRTLILRATQGYGKSVVLAQNWLAFRAAGNHAAWVSLRDGCETEGALAETIYGQLLDTASRESRAVPADLAELVATLWEEFGAERPINVICIDDIEHAPGLLHALEAFARESPPNVRFAIAGDTRRGFARLGLESGVREIFARDLAFTLDDAETFMQMHPAANVTARQMIAETQGWPALCHIMCRTELPARPAVTWPETVTFLHEEIERRLSRRQLEFVENAAMIDPISAESYNYAYKSANAAALIEEIDLDHLLFRPAEGDPTLFSLHPVLRDYLQHRFLARSAERKSYVLKRAAFWHWRRREFQRAVNLALRAGDHRWALGLSEDIMLDLALRQGEIEALREWLGRFPTRELRKHPIICLSYAWTMYFSQQADMAEKLLGYLPAPRTPSDAHPDRGWLQLVRAIGAATHDEFQLSERLCGEWIQTFGDDNSIGKGAALTCIAFMLASEYRFGELKQALVMAHSVNSAARQHYASGWLYAAEIQAALARGDIRTALQLIDTARKDRDVQVTGTSFTSKILIALELEALFEQRRLDLDENAIASLLDFIFNYGVTDIFYGVSRVIAAWHRAKGNIKGAAALLERARALAAERSLPRLGVLIELELAELALFSGAHDVDHLLPRDSHEVLSGPHARPLRAQLSLLRAMEAIAREQHSLALRNAEAAARISRSIGAGRLEVRALMCEAAAHAAAGALTPARRKAVNAFELIKQLGCYRTGLDTRDLLLTLTPASADAFATFDFDSIARPQPRAERPSLPPELTSLTVRQISVLRLARDGLSNKRIADQLLVSEDTVKWHMRKIFADLKARNRVQAISEAERRNLI
ncbi:LuxR C-terminal-related transcriptional regulator [Bradyrhizobium sp.]|uniref:LuxR C-terminal-related transcriptional regulator n=1 Tax=Bradyrhizobium sp. TaxID=376 RepID=UPI0025BEAB87|nr:LuxR C-terminal-related transcriptional regulator [Bradyrhizobium sp.]